MQGRRKIAVLSEAVICSFGILIFAFFIQYKFPVRLISISALLVSAYIISRNIRTRQDLNMVFGESRSFKIILIFTIIGIALGITGTILYRKSLDLSLLPGSVHLFMIPAALIGCMEELVFRGFIQGYVNRINGLVSVLVSTLSHTGYKCCLFLAPVVATDIDIGYLAFYTFVAGILLGAIRHLSKSLIPSLSAHALFDILVYAEAVRAPWWVW